MRWYNYIGLGFVGIFLVYFGGGIWLGMTDRTGIIPILVILVFTGGVILLNKHGKTRRGRYGGSSSTNIFIQPNLIRTA
jgi:sorbitol-specific phosphotransferase system component IIC